MSAVVEDESPAVVEWDLLGLPGGTLVEALGLCAGGVHSSLKLRMAGPFFAEATNGRADGEDQVCRSLLRAKAFPDAVLR